jgi:Putative zinc-finger
MDHETAIQMKAPERYAIGELAATDRDQFEEHFAGCSRCLEEVGALVAFAANARAVFRERAAVRPLAAPVSRSRFWSFRWQIAVPAFAALLLAALAIYQNSITIPGLRAPQSFMPAIVLDGATRAALPRLREDAPLRFQMALAPGAESGRVWAELIGPGGHTLSAGWVALPAAAGDPLDVYFPIRLEPGRYTVVIRAGQAGGAELARNRFEITRQEPSTP